MFLTLNLSTAIILKVMKKHIFFILGIFALVGILNCTLIEPAFACKDEVTHSEQAGDSDCCFIHCSMHHQWFASGTSTLFHNFSCSADFISASVTFHLDTPPGSIFHPPLAL